MIHYGEASDMNDVAQVDVMSKAAAKKLTKKIKGATDHLWYLLIDAHDGKAWKALGYATWEAYVKAEFGMGRAHSYRLLDQGRIIQAIEEATGGLSPSGDISEAVARDLKADLPALTEEIKAKVDAGEVPAKAVADTVAAKRAEKDEQRKARAAEQEKFDRQRDETLAKLPPAIKDREQAKAEWRAMADKGKAAEAAVDRVAELEEAVRVLEAEVEELRAENKLYGEMKVQFAQGGFEKVVADKDEEIRALQTRLYRESGDKASWMNSAKYWQEEARKLGFTRDVTIDIATGEVVDG